MATSDQQGLWQLFLYGFSSHHYYNHTLPQRHKLPERKAWMVSFLLFFFEVGMKSNEPHYGVYRQPLLFLIPFPGCHVYTHTPPLVPPFPQMVPLLSSCGLSSTTLSSPFSFKVFFPSHLMVLPSWLKTNLNFFHIKMWYFSFWLWLILLNIIIANSIHFPTSVLITGGKNNCVHILHFLSPLIC